MSSSVPAASPSPSRRYKGDGSVAWHARHNLWIAQATINRRRISRYFKGKPPPGKPPREAIQWLHDQHARAGDQALTGGRVTLGRYIDTWLKLRSGTLAAGTIRDYGFTAAKFEPLWTIPLKRLNADILQEQFDDIAAAGVAPSTIAKYKAQLSAVLNDAVGRGIIAGNPLRRVETPSVTRRDPVGAALTRAQADAVITAAVTPSMRRLVPLWTFLLSTGLRNGELRALRWSDVDPATGTVYVHRGLTETGQVDLQTKTRRNRVIALSRIARGALDQQRALQEDERARHGWEPDGDFVFTRRTTGRPYAADEIRKQWKRLTRAAGLGADVRIHDIRHTVLTWLLSAGVPVHVVSKWAGHASSKVTLDVYGHALDESISLAAEVLDRQLATGTPAPAASDPADTL